MLADVCSVLARLRTRDVLELAEYGVDRDGAVLAFTAPAALSHVFAYRGRPVAIVTFHQLTPKALVVSMMTTDDWPRVARAVMGWGVRVARPALLAQGFERAECRTMEGHAEAIRLLERLGFVLECRLPRFGASGAAFLQYAWRINDHVHVQNTQSAAPATAAADTRVKGG
ncbi:MAG: hypothetical protein KBA31_19535 [Alphaproteobacteria bacterium]|nr:hypothetical protein [Alphaproteobacteria bacterium]